MEGRWWVFPYLKSTRCLVAQGDVILFKFVAESNKKTGFHEDSRGIVAYDDEDMF